MLMKDKLVKTNHKGMYYTVRKATVVLTAVFGLGFTVAVPTYILNTSAHKNAALASDTSDQNSDTENDGENYVSYNNQEN